MDYNDPRTYNEKLARGQAQGGTVWSKIGYNNAVGAATQTLWMPGGLYVYPAAGIQMQVVSTGAGAGNDVAAGTGVQQVQIFYLTTAFVEASEIVTMTGAVAALTAAVNIYRVQDFIAYRCGATVPAGAAGTTINLQSVGGAVNYSQILQGQTAARNITYTVPVNKTLYTESLTIGTGSSAAAKFVQFTLRATYDDAGAGRVLPANFFMPFAEASIQDQSFFRPIDVPLRFPTGVDMKVDALSDSAGAICSAAMRGYLLTTSV